MRSYEGPPGPLLCRARPETGVHSTCAFVAKKKFELNSW
jgi:hypothetical protein